MLVNIPEDRTLSGDKIVALLLAAGMVAYVEQTGGGCATIYASRTADADGAPFVHDYVETDGSIEKRAEVAMGPGWFEGPGWTDGRFSALEASVGPHDDGEVTPYFTVESDTDESVAAKMLEQLRALS